MREYHDLVRLVLNDGEPRADRTGVGTRAVFGVQSRHDLREGFPILTTKKVLWTGVVRELLWFLRGATNINDDLTQHTPIWDAWADADGNLGPIYGFQWRKWGQTAEQPGIDQIRTVIEQIRTDPFSRRILVSAWNVADLPKMRLPPCHILFQFFVAGEYLDCQLYQRSADIALGVPFNIASYALLLAMVAQETGKRPRFFIHTLGDAHIYQNHIEGLQLQLTRTPKARPRLVLADKSMFEMTFDDIRLEGYNHDPLIKFEVAV